jgi:hypothetical protein
MHFSISSAVSEEYNASIFRVKRHARQQTRKKQAGRWRRYVPPKRGRYNTEDRALDQYWSENLKFTHEFDAKRVA